MSVERLVEGGRTADGLGDEPGDAAHVCQQGFVGFEERLRSGIENGARLVPHGLRIAQDRAVEIGDCVRVRPAAERPGLARRAGAQLDQQSVTQGRSHAVAFQQRQAGLMVGEAEDRHPRRCHGLRQALFRFGAVRQERRAFGRRPVPDGHRVPLGQECLGQGIAHVAKPDEANLRAVVRSGHDRALPIASP